MTTDEETLLTFPCAFPIKAMGRAGEGFEALMVDIVSRHAPGLDLEQVTVRASSGGTWRSSVSAMRLSARPAREPASGAAPGRYLPVSTPRAIGL